MIVPKNLWRTFEAPLVTWTVHLDEVAFDAERWLDLTLAIVLAGESERVVRIDSAPRIDYVRSRDGPLEAKLRARLDDDGVVDLFAFTGFAMGPDEEDSSRAVAEMAWYAPDGRIEVGETDNLAKPLWTEDPDGTFLTRGESVAVPAVRIRGCRIDRHGRRADPAAPHVRVMLQSDIWMPFVSNPHHPAYPDRLSFDNRPLARQHTPRLNRFLREVRSQVERLGGRWALEETETMPGFMDDVGPDGVDL